MTTHAITESDLWETAWRRHLEGIGARLCPRVPFAVCDSPPCVLASRAFARSERTA